MVKILFLQNCYKFFFLNMWSIQKVNFKEIDFNYSLIEKKTKFKPTDPFNTSDIEKKQFFILSYECPWESASLLA